MKRRTVPMLPAICEQISQRDSTNFWTYTPPPEELAIRAGLSAEEVRKRITVSEWLEIARDLYAFFSNTGRRPALLSPADIEMLEEMRQVGEWEPHHFLRAVVLMVGDSAVDHDKVDVLPWCNHSAEHFYGRPGNKPGCPMDWLDYCTAIHIEERRKDAALHPDPNCRARNHLGRYFPVYDFATAVSKARGKCWLSENTTAKWTGLTRKTARKHIGYLVDAGWLVELKKPQRGVNGAGEYRVVEHDEWVGKFGSGECAKLAKAKQRYGNG